MNKNERIIEVNGVKLAVDMRYARTIDHYAIGQNVKVLIKEYNDKYKSYSGVIVGFDNFTSRPTIVIAYLENDYNPDIKFVFLSKDNTDVEICPMSDDEQIFDKQSIIDKFDHQIEQAEAKVLNLKEKKSFFMRLYGKTFETEDNTKKEE